LRQLAIENVEISPADSARPDLEEDLAWTWIRRWQLSRFEWMPLGVENHCAHDQIEAD